MLIKHVLSNFTKFVKTRFLAEKSGSQLRCRTMLKCVERFRKHHLKIFRGLDLFWKHCSRLKNPVLGSDVKQKNTLKHPENTNKKCFEAFWEIFENPVLGSKMWFSAQISNYAKIPWNTQKTPTKHALRHSEKFWKSKILGWKIRFSAQMLNYAKIPWNTQKTPTKHVSRLFKKFLKIGFLAQTSGSWFRCRTMLKIPWNNQKTPTKHVLRLFKKFLKTRFSAKKSGSRLRCRTMQKKKLKHSENTN